MKSVVALCILAVFCVLHAHAAGPLDVVNANIQRAKSNLNSIQSDLQRTKNTAERNTQNKLSNLKFDQMSNLNNMVNPALNDLRNKVDAAKAQGKDAEPCYTNAQSSLRTVSLNGFSELNNCEKNAMSGFQGQLTKFEVLKQLAQEYVGKLDGVMRICYNSNINGMATCAAIEVGKINQEIRVLENTVSSTKREVDSASGNAVVQATSCNLGVMSTVRQGNTDTILASNACLNNL